MTNNYTEKSFPEISQKLWRFRVMIFGSRLTGIFIISFFLFKQEILLRATALEQQIFSLSNIAAVMKWEFKDFESPKPF